MKPNDKAIEAEAVREVKSILNTISPVTDNETIAQNIVGKIIAAYAAQFPSSEEYAVLIRELRMRPHRRGYETEDEAKVRRQKEREEAADALEAVLAERDTVRKELIDEIKRLDRERIAWKKQQEETAALLKQVEAERDALLARLAPVDDKALVEIAVQAGYKAEYEADMSVGQAEPIFVEAIYKPLSIYKPIMIAAIAAIRPHIEAAERERCVKAVKTVGKKINVAPHELTEYLDGYLQGVHDAAAAIRSGK